MKHKGLICVIAACVIAFSGVSALAGDYMEGWKDGVQAAEDAHNGVAQFVGGVALGVFYVIYALLASPPNPSPWRLDDIEDRSDSYQRGYLEGFEKEWGRTRTVNATSGMLTWAVIYLSIVLGAY